MINILIAHHISIVADLERFNAAETRKKAFKAVDEAIAIFEKVTPFLWLLPRLVERSHNVIE